MQILPWPRLSGAELSTPAGLLEALMQPARRRLPPVYVFENAEDGLPSDDLARKHVKARVDPEWEMRSVHVFSI